MEKEDDNMTQDERWMAKYNEVVMFIETNKRNPSKYVDAERPQKLGQAAKEAHERWRAGRSTPKAVQ